MMRNLRLFLCLGLALGGGAPCAAAPAPAPPPAAAPAPAGWKLVFADEFDGKALDPAKWTTYGDCWGGGNLERECYTARPENVSVHDGYLDLAARFERATGPALALDARSPGVPSPEATKPFTSGKVSTLGKFALTYGRVEVRARSPLGQGVWPAIWLLPEQFAYGKWPGSGEIDVMETVNLGVHCGGCPGGIQNNVYATLHYGSFMHHQSQQRAAQLPKGTEGDWHVYVVDWSPGAMDWYLDGKSYAHIKLGNWRDTLQKGEKVAPAQANAPFDRPFYLILNFAVGGQWPEGHDLGGVTLQGYPKSFAIDWVRIYQPDGAAK